MEKFFGWVGQDKSEKHFNTLAEEFKQFYIVGLSPTQTKRRMLYDVTRKVLTKDTSNYAQQIGDCTAFGNKNVLEYLQCVQILLAGTGEFRPIFPPYTYGASRVFIGKGQLGNEDGSSGAWTASASMKYGELNTKEEGVPLYSGTVSKKWGLTGPPTNFVNFGQQHIVKSCARLFNVQSAMLSLINGYPITIASNQGFQMLPSADGFHEVNPNDPWPHQMAIIGVDEEYKYPYYIILNSWGDVHGHLTDFTTSDNLPVGVLRVHKEIINSMINEGEAYTHSQFTGFLGQSDKLDEKLFKLVN